MARRFVGSWVLPSGNSCDVHLTDSGLECLWDTPPPAWPKTDTDHWRAVTFPAILRASPT